MRPMDDYVESAMRNQINRSANTNQKHNKSHRDSGAVSASIAARVFKILTNGKQSSVSTKTSFSMLTLIVQCVTHPSAHRTLPAHAV